MWKNNKCSPTTSFTQQPFNCNNLDERYGALLNGWIFEAYKTPTENQMFPFENNNSSPLLFSLYSFRKHSSLCLAIKCTNWSLGSDMNILECVKITFNDGDLPGFSTFEFFLIWLFLLLLIKWSFQFVPRLRFFIIIFLFVRHFQHFQHSRLLCMNKSPT